MEKKLLCSVLLVMLCVLEGFTQTIVTGTVKDSRGETLPGVSVMVKGMSTGATTDVNGRYSVNVPKDASTLIFSFIGMLSQEIVISDRKQIDIILSQDSATLKEVVVIGYGSQKKVNLTGAVESIGSEYFQDRPVSNVARALQGVIPNLNINYSNGRPTTSPAWNVRGLTSIGAGGEALILIDGVIGNPSNLNPNDIESISVLKDAASAAIYGSRGAFGVILITTKTPGKTKPQITYSGNYSLNDRTVTRDIVTDSYTWAKMYNESYSAWYDYTRPPTTVGASGLNFSTSYLDALKIRADNPGKYPEIDINPATGEYEYYGNTDWYKELYAKNIPTIENSLIVTGAGEKADYTISGRSFRQDGLYNIRSDQFNRYNLRFKGGIQVKDWLRFTGNVDFSNSKYVDPFSGTQIWGLLNTSGLAVPMGVMRNPDGTLTKTAAIGMGSLYGKSQTITNQSQMQQSIGFSMSLIKNVLNLKGDFTYQNSVNALDGKSVPVPFGIKPGGAMGVVGTSSLSNSTQTQNYFANNLYADFTHSFGRHNVKVLVGGNMETSKVAIRGVSRSDLIIEDLSDFNLATGNVFSITGGGNEWSTVGIFSRLNYDYKERYLLEVNTRYDGSSKFPGNERFGFFPSVSAGWRISEESFLKGTKNWLDNFKVRASYGSLGNSQISPYLFIEQIRAIKSNRVINGQLPVLINNPSILPDNFTWETATTFNVGTDIDVLRSRLGLSFDWYRRETTNMITPGPVLPVVFGAAIPKGNYADLETKGFELSLRWNDQIKLRKPISYGIRLTLGDNDSYITKYNNPLGLLIADPNTFVMGYYEGMRVGDMWGMTTDRLFTSKEDIANSPNQSFIQSSNLSILLPGDIKFKDINNDGKIDKGQSTLANHGDLSIIGNTRPRYNYGITLNSNWNNFSISAFFQGVGKRDWYPMYGTTEFWGQYTVWYANIPRHTLRNAYTLDNPDPNAFWPRYKGPSSYGNRGLQAQTRYLQNAAYIRLKDLNIAYSLPTRVIEKVKLTNARIYVSGQNIWTYSPIFKITKDIDPEAIEGTGNNYPMLKSITVGLSLTF